MRAGVLSLAVVAALAVAPAALAKGKPDLSVRSISKPPASVERTAGFDVTSTVRNAAGSAKASKTSFYLSRSTRKARGAILLKPDQVVPKLKARASAVSTTTLVVPGAVPVGTYHVIACADATRKVREHSENNNCKAARGKLKVTAAQKPPAGKSSSELIDSAVSGHKISAETGVLYKVYALYRDPQLPSQFRGNDSGRTDDSLMADVAGKLKTFSPAVRAKLAPFFVPPYYASSWWAIQHGEAASGTVHGAHGAEAESPRCGAGVAGGLLQEWKYTDTTDGNFRVWWEKGSTADAARAARIASDLKGTIFPKEAGLMAPSEKAPLNDHGATDICRGGSDAFDVALTTVSRTETLPDDFSCSETSSRMNVVHDGTNPATLAHELFHAFQFTYKTAGSCSEYHWLREATAEWAEDYVYHCCGNEEHASNPYFFDFPDTPLEYSNDQHEYGDWVVFLYLRNRIGLKIIPEIWGAAASKSDSLEAVQSALRTRGSSFQDVWPDFEFHVWNRAPWDFFQQWDPAFLEAAKVSAIDGTLSGAPIDVRLDAHGDGFYLPRVDVPHLGARFFDFNLQASNVKTLAFSSTLVDPAHIQGLVRIGSSWRDAGDWSFPLQPVFYCRDFPGEDVNELVLIVSNSSTDRNDVIDPGTLPPELVGTNIGCMKWTGSFNGSETWTNAAIGENLTATWSGNATFVRNGNQFPTVLQSTSAAITWQLSGTLYSYPDASTCTEQAGPVVLTSEPNSGQVELALTNFHDPRAYRIQVLHVDDVPGVVSCEPGGISYPSTAHPHPVWLGTVGAGSQLHDVPASGQITGDAQATEADGGVVKWHWTFSAQ